MGDEPIARPLPAHSTAQTQNKRTHTFMPQVRFEPTIPVFEQAKTVYALGRVYTRGQDDVPTITEEYIYVRSKKQHEADRDERLAS
jgi:hypothetical protein